MAIPTVHGVGAKAAGAGNVTPALPASTQANDILLVYAETNNASTISVNNSYAEVADSPQGTAAGNTTKLHVWWKRHSGSESDPTVTQGGTTDHVCAGIIAIRGCITSGDPWDVTAGTVEAVNDTSADPPTDTTTVNDCLILFAVATTQDSNVAQGSSASAASLSSVGLTALNYWTNTGGGGGVAVASGGLATAGSTGALSITLANGSIKGLHTLALKPPAAQTIAVGQITEANTAQAMGRAKTRALGLVTETDTALPLVMSQTVPMGLASETDTAQAMGRAKTKAIGLTSETDTALAMTERKTRAVGLASETDTALPVTRTKLKTLGLATETDQALNILAVTEGGGGGRDLPLLHAGK